MSLAGHPVLPTDPLKLDRVFLWDVFRQLGTQYGDRLFARIMDGDHDDVPLQTITWGKLLSDAYKVADAMKAKAGNPLEPITYALLASSSYVYFTHIIAGWLNHWPVLLLSLRNSVVGNVHLLRTVNANVLLVDDKSAKTAEVIAREYPINIIDLQNPDDLHAKTELSASPVQVVQASPEEFRRVILYLHSSGTSGHPKPISQSHEHLVNDLIAARCAPAYPGSPGYCPLPLFHGMGLYGCTRFPICMGIIPTFIDTKLPVTSASVLRHLKRLPNAVCFIAPSLLEDALREPPEDCEVLKTCRRIFHSGAPLNRQACTRLLEMGVPVIAAFGSTETSSITELDFPGPPETRVFDGPYVRFNDFQYNYHFIPFDGKLSELVICPGKIGVTCVFNHDDPKGYTTNDLWEPHPAIKGLWKHSGRKDSVTVLSNGEKTDNRQIELLLMEDPRVSGVVVFGSGRPLNGVIVRPDPSAYALSTEQFIDAIWLTIEHVNTIVPNHSRVIRHMVLVADMQNKPFLESDKGTIKTKDTLVLYKNEIDAAYEALERQSGLEAVKDVDTPQEIRKFVREVIHKVAGRSLDDNDDFFENGLDSLHSVQIRTEIIPLFNKFVQGEVLSHNIAYAQPTVSHLAEYLIKRSQGEAVVLDDPVALTSRIQNCIERWTANLPERQPSLAPESSQKVFALTGSTGSLGVHTLRYLLERDDVKKVYCFHRGPSDVAIQRHRKLFEKRALPVELLDSAKVAFVQVDLSKPDLGLTSDMYNELRENLTHIVHTAWELNFNWGLERFEKVHVGGVRHLIDLSLASRLPSPPRLVFISSIGVVNGYSTGAAVPEATVENENLIGGRGYGEAKFVSERILEKAVKVSGVPVTIIRSGQIAGSSIDGYWAPTEYIPMIFRSSKILGKVPNKLPETRWLPADYCGRAVLDLALANKEMLQYYHLENPTATPWDVIVSLFIQKCNAKMEVMDTKDWLAAVERASKEGAEIPAASLLHFYLEYSATEVPVYLATDKAQEASSAIAYGPVTSELMRKYISWI